ncbi:MAG: hypothetical protein HYZ01_06040 [Ignavibacteriales bacterium]|nr:hypothetical protein [Ignavibacteriales bacterium]
MRFFFLFLMACLFTFPAIAQENPPVAAPDSTVQEEGTSNPWTERKVMSVILSAVIPGAGQTYLGHMEKGAAFTIGTVASALMAGLSENNIVGRNERLDELKVQYSAATSYIGADTVWSKMVSTKDILGKDVKRRDIFVKVAIGLWVANMVDIILFSDDRGEKPFGLLNTPRATFAIVPDTRNGLNAALTVRF